MTDIKFLERNPNYFKEYYLRNREVILNRSKARKPFINREKANEYQRLWRSRNKIKLREYASRYRQKYRRQNNVTNKLHTNTPKVHS